VPPSIQALAGLQAVQLRPDPRIAGSGCRTTGRWPASIRIISLVTPDSSVALIGRNGAGCDLTFVRGKSSKDLGLFARRDLEMVECSSELGCDFIAFCGRNPQALVRFLKAQRRRAGPGGRVWNGPPEMLQTHSVRMNLRPGNLARFLVCHARNCGFLDFWPTMGFLTIASLK
jgi:hypothetical protein